jgi:hypothetical protein
VIRAEQQPATFQQPPTQGDGFLVPAHPLVLVGEAFDAGQRIWMGDAEVLAAEGNRALQMGRVNDS